MASKSKEARLEQKAYWENKLTQRLSVLTEKGFEAPKIAKDSAVRKIRGKIRESGARLKTIADLEKKNEEMARIKAEKMAAPQKEKKTEKAPEMSKRQQKKTKKKESKDKT